MSNQESTPRQRQIAEFVANLERLDAAGRARLKRNAGRRLNEARDVQRVFFQALPYALAGRAFEEEIYFLVATLYPLADSRNDSTNLGQTMRRVRQTRESESIDRRFQSLLDSNSEQLPFRLRQIVRLAAASEQTIDWAQLLQDLLAWEHPERYIQLRWARNYFVGE
ncbi:type I-E CRISPR-associated protein Cse2/CasB [Candidatus Viridilinea mediisalina]|uniref:type I-E CRISPR-associated protein Cse2/CasB n=1 Tax=Candidatus Viridilinea mediisalina TaxID=2024553 RepID=UPI0013FD151D|nr:type I-E CRISPR-associated protein Cse2/CasB [Candidatus Viridilinea mediisalina]